MHDLMENQQQAQDDETSQNGRPDRRAKTGGQAVPPLLQRALTRGEVVGPAVRQSGVCAGDVHELAPDSAARGANRFGANVGVCCASVCAVDNVALGIGPSWRRLGPAGGTDLVHTSISGPIRAWTTPTTPNNA